MVSSQLYLHTLDDVGTYPLYLNRDEFKTDQLSLPTTLQSGKVEQLQYEKSDSSLVSPTSSEDLSSNEDTDSDDITSAVSDGLLRAKTATPLPSPSPIKGTRIDWTSVAATVRRPRLVFDGRNIVEAEKLEALGFQVHTIGGAGPSARRRQ